MKTWEIFKINHGIVSQLSLTTLCFFLTLITTCNCLIFLPHWKHTLAIVVAASVFNSWLCLEVTGHSSPLKSVLGCNNQKMVWVDLGRR